MRNIHIFHQYCISLQDKFTLCFLKSLIFFWYYTLGMTCEVPPTHYTWPPKCTVCLVVIGHQLRFVMWMRMAGLNPTAKEFPFYLFGDVYSIHLFPGCTLNTWHLRDPLVGVQDLERKRREKWLEVSEIWLRTNDKGSCSGCSRLTQEASLQQARATPLLELMGCMCCSLLGTFSVIFHSII